MNIVINGEAVEIREGINVLQWLQEQKTVTAAAVVERNGEILSRNYWSETVLKEGDRLEVFQFLGGG